MADDDIRLFVSTYCVAELEALGAAAEPLALLVAALLRRRLSKEEERSDDDTSARELTWERLHSGRWDAVPVAFREAYGAIELLDARCFKACGDTSSALRALDMCLLMGGPRSRSLASRLVSTVEEGARGAAGGKPTPCKRDPVPATGVASTHLEVDDGKPAAEGAAGASQSGRKRPRPSSRSLRGPREAILRVEAPSLSDFLDRYMHAKVPVIITGAMQHWPAMGPGDRAWSNLEYLRSVAGQRTVPVEIGKNYLAEDWSQQLLSLGEFIDRFVLGTGDAASSQVGYLAQHQLFEQVASLRRDVCIPDYCALECHDQSDARVRSGGGGDDGGGGSGGGGRDGDGDHDHDHDHDEGVVLNAWFGPRGTVSPLHFDPRHNLLAQVVGRKYICLFRSEHSAALYPDEGGLMPNNSRVDFDHPDPERFPLFGDVPGLECELRAGEMLYIPPTFWHYVRSESVSFSVSFWWGRRRSLP